MTTLRFEKDPVEAATVAALQAEIDRFNRAAERVFGYREIATRLADPRYAGRRVTVNCRRVDGAFTVCIRDDGDGFDYTKYLDRDASRVFDQHGRGIAMARTMSFDRLEYRGRGNDVEVAVNTPRLASHLGGT
jgi:hypothetical protein